MFLLEKFVEYWSGVFIFEDLVELLFASGSFFLSELLQRWVLDVLFGQIFIERPFDCCQEVFALLPF